MVRAGWSVIEAVPLARVPMPGGAPCVSNVTLCCAANNHVTVPFRVTVTVAGVNWLLAVAATLAAPKDTVTFAETLLIRCRHLRAGQITWSVSATPNGIRGDLPRREPHLTSSRHGLGHRA